jgi:hypothetical protein
MTRDRQVLERLRAADPAPGDARIDPGELSAIFSLLEERRGAVTTQTPIRPRVPEPESRRWLRPALAFGVALVVVMIAVGIGVFLFGDDGSEDVIAPPETTLPIQTTAPAPTTTPTTEPSEGGPPSTTRTTIPSTLPSLTWTQAELPGRHALLVGTGPDQLFATADEVLHVSNTGSDWTAVEGLPGSLTIREVIYGDGRYLALGYDYPVQDLVMYSSSDLTAWVRIEEPPPNVNGIAYGAGLFVAVGEDATMSGTGDARGIESIHAGVWTSPDGDAWSQVGEDADVFQGLHRANACVEPQDVAYGPSGFVMVGQDDYTSDWVTGVAWHSPDGVEWTRSTGDFDSVGGDSGLYAVTHGGSGYVATGLLDPYASAIWYSPDGGVWERITSNISDSFLTDTVSIESGYLAVGDDYTTGVIFFSADGRNWQVLPDDGAFSPNGEFSVLRHVAATERLIVVSGFQEQDAIDPPPNDPLGDKERVSTIWYAPLP